MNRKYAVAAGLLAALSLGACARSDSPTGVDPTLAVGDRNNLFSLATGIVNVCAFVPEDVPSGTLAGTFRTTAAAGDVIQGDYDIAPSPYCIEVWNATGDGPVSVTTELVNPGPAFELSFIAVTSGTEFAGYDVLTGVRSATVNASATTGAFVWFKFEKKDEPPMGGQGCTPGYWRQAHHFDSWPSPYLPTAPFSSVFANAFPGQTLAQVVALGGGGLNALGRSAVAALLNAASADVSYDLTPQQVIDAFNAAAASGNRKRIEEQKNVFDMLNNQGCPLN